MTRLPLPRIVAAGRGKSVALGPIASKIIELTQKRRPTVLYLGTATYDREAPFLAQTKGLRSAGCRIIKLDLSRKYIHECGDECENDCDGHGPSRGELEEAFEKADALLASGGNTMYAVRQWKKLGVDKIIRERAFREENPLVLCGGSAGAVCWFAHGHSDSKDPMNVPSPDPTLTEEDKRNWDYVRVSGMNIIPALCIPHHDVTPSNGKPRSSDSNKMILRNPQELGIGIDEKAALVIVGDQISSVSADGKAKCYTKICQLDGDEKVMRINKITESDEELFLSDLLEQVKED
jgi:dipeptidase E